MLSVSVLFFFFNDTATTEIYTPLYTLSLHDALPISPSAPMDTAPSHLGSPACAGGRSEEHTSELQSHSGISYAVFCLKKKKNKQRQRSRQHRPQSKVRQEISHRSLTAEDEKQVHHEGCLAALLFFF